MKDTRGFWMGDYWGSVTIGYNANLVKTPPKTFADLLEADVQEPGRHEREPAHVRLGDRGRVRRRARERRLAQQRRPGIDWFAKCKSAGNYIPVETTPQTVASGQTPISIDWDYNNFAYVKEFPAANWKVTIPTDGQYGGYYCQAVNATAPHPFAARLWQEFIYSDQGQLLYLKGYRASRALRRPGRAEGDPEVTDGDRSRPAGSTPRRSSRASASRRPRRWSSTTSGRPRSARAEPLATQAVTQDGLRPGPKPGRRRPSLAWLGVVPFFAYATHVPHPAGGDRDDRRFQGRRRRLHGRQRHLDRRDGEPPDTHSGRASGSASRRRSSAGCSGS